MKLLRALITMTLGAIALMLPFTIALAVSVLAFRWLVTSGCGS